MFKYVKKYLPFALLAVLCMSGEVIVDLLQPSFMSKIVDNGVLGINNNGVGDMSIILNTGFKMVLIVFIGGLSGALNSCFVHLTSKKVANDIRKDAFAKIMNFSFSQVDKFKTGSLITRVTNDTIQIQQFVGQLIRGGVRTILLSFGSIFFMYRLNKHFGMVMLGIFPILLVILFIFLYNVNPLFYKLQSQLDNINNIMQEDLSGIRIIKACVKEIYEKIRFQKANDDLIKIQLKSLIIFSFMNPSMNIIMYIVTAIIILIGANDVVMGYTTPGSIMAAVTYINQMLHGILMLVMLFQSISRGISSWKRIKEVLDSESDLVDGSYVTNDVTGKIEFENVSFAYPNTSEYVLKDINLTIEPNSTVAIMGATGSGKSTLVNLINRFYDVSKGSIKIDGVDVKNFEIKNLRSNIAIALQRSELFNTTIANNISWGKEDASVDEIKQAAKIAQADSFIMDTNNGYDTMVAQRGMSLSGGQKQRLSISRAVVKKAPILIFDDSTSALDLKTEANLYDALESAYPNTTKIIVAQRIASVKRADKIVVLSDETIEACGTHEELLKTSKVYKDIYDSQIGKDELAYE